MSSFALFRNPADTSITLISDEKGVVNEIDESILSYIISPFDNLDKQKVIVANSESKKYNSFEQISLFTIIKLEEICLLNALNDNHLTVTTKDSYIKDFSSLKKVLEEGCLDKVVLARNKKIARNIDGYVNLFKIACDLYKDSYIALFSSKQSGTWLVASPELLIEKRGDKGRTMALAGTMAQKAYKHDKIWDNKNQKEQYIVEEYIRERLNDHVINLNVGRTYTTHAADLVHLRTDFVFTIKPNFNGQALVECLHPTPAVCGMPADKAMEFIRDTESISRDYYGGYSGVVYTNGDFSHYVTLRCALIQPDYYILYAGGGILANSDCTTEWNETESKMHTINRVIDAIEE